MNNTIIEHREKIWHCLMNNTSSTIIDYYLRPTSSSITLFEITDYSIYLTNKRTSPKSRNLAIHLPDSDLSTWLHNVGEFHNSKKQRFQDSSRKFEKKKLFFIESSNSQFSSLTIYLSVFIAFIHRGRVIPFLWNFSSSSEYQTLRHFSRIDASRSLQK